MVRCLCLSISVTRKCGLRAGNHFELVAWHRLLWGAAAWWAACFFGFSCSICPQLTLLVFRGAPAQSFLNYKGRCSSSERPEWDPMRPVVSQLVSTLQPTLLTWSPGARCLLLALPQH